MVDVVKYEHLDLLHVHYAIPHASAAFMAQQILKSQGIDIPFITTLHGTDITLVGRDPSFEPVISFCLNASDAVTAVSKSLMEDTLTHFSTKREIHVIPNFIHVPDDLPVINMEKRRQYADDEERIICHVSNFRPVKRLEDVIKTFYLIQKEIPAKLLLCGDGPDRAKAEHLGRELNICQKIKFIGKVRDAGSILQLSDLFLLPSETESFGLAALEAMAEGVPVVSSNTGGIPEVNVHGVSGYLSNVGDVEDMAKHSLEILRDTKTLEQFRQAALTRASEFKLEKVLPVYEELYEQVVKSVKV
jgi:N-acetyl-alpha-D-glucosaminyl L-malate synthase BshA